MTLPILKHEGNTPSQNDWLNRLTSGSAIGSIIIFMIRFDTPSYPLECEFFSDLTMDLSSLVVIGDRGYLVCWAATGHQLQAQPQTLLIVLGDIL